MIAISVCAVMLVKDEIDVIEYTIRHLLTHVSHIIVADNDSTDGTREVLDSFPITVIDDHEVGYFQSRKTTELALRAYHEGYGWVLPCDADELWYAPDGRLIRDYLDGIAPDVRVVRGALYNHLPSGDDDVKEQNPLVRIRWRQKHHAPIGKICIRAGMDVVIHQGNHSAYHEGRGLTVDGLNIRHFSWRSADQYLHKIRTGSAAYAATDMDEEVGAHWRMFDNSEDQAIIDHYERWFYTKEPRNDSSLIFDPAPYAGAPIIDDN